MPQIPTEKMNQYEYGYSGKFYLIEIPWAIEMQPSQIQRYFRSTEAHSSQNESFRESHFLVKIVPSLPV